MKNKAMSLGAGTLTFHPADGGPAIGPFPTSGFVSDLDQAVDNADKLSISVDLSGVELLPGEIEKTMAYKHYCLNPKWANELNFGGGIKPNQTEAPITVDEAIKLGAKAIADAGVADKKVNQSAYDYLAHIFRKTDFKSARFSDGGIVEGPCFGQQNTLDYRDTPASNALIPTPGYERLVAVFKAAHDQAAKGKGADRHANGLPFHEQRMQLISQLFDSPVGMAYQVAKKVAEGLDLPTHERQIAELYGALNYLAGIVIFLDDKQVERLTNGQAQTIVPTRNWWSNLR